MHAKDDVGIAAIVETTELTDEVTSTGNWFVGNVKEGFDIEAEDYKSGYLHAHETTSQ